MVSNVGKISGNTYVSNVNGNNALPPSLRLNHSAQVYNTNYPRTTSDYSQECFTDGYYTKADKLDYLA